MFKGLGNFAGILKEVQQLQGRAEEMQAKLGQLRVEGNAGGGMVTVVANGLMKILEVKIENSLFESPDPEMLGELILAATNQALEKAREASSEEMSKIYSGFRLPGLTEMISKLGLGGSSGRGS